MAWPATRCWLLLREAVVQAFLAPARHCKIGRAEHMAWLLTQLRQCPGQRDASFGAGWLGGPPLPLRLDKQLA